MKYQMRKIINGQEDNVQRWNIEEKLEEDEKILPLLKEYVPGFMEDIIDPDMASGSIDKYINNLSSGRLGDFSKRYIIFAYDGERPIGGIIALPMKTDNAYHILTVGVNEEYRKKGVASALLSHCINYMYKRNIESLILDVYENNTPAVSLYKKFGFHQV